jgi:sRNA-binding carbon storage regulator CsrA
MLVLGVPLDGKITLDLRDVGRGLVTVMVVRVKGDFVRLGIDADARIPIAREDYKSGQDVSRDGTISKAAQAKTA